MKKCPQCGTLNPASAKFCRNCGTDISAVPVEATKTDQGQTNYSQAPINTPSAATPSPNHPQPRHHIWLGILLAILLVAVSAGGSYWYFGIHQQAGSTQTSKKEQHNDEASSLARENSKLKADRSSSDSASETSTQATAPKSFSDAQKEQINQAFLDWASERAKIGNMAVSPWYFDHGSDEAADWVANTPDGKVLVQDVQNDAGSYEIQALGGVIFYTSRDGTTGLDNRLQSGSFADGYSTNMDFSKSSSKYLLGSNGVVYELKNSSGRISPDTGFGQRGNETSLSFTRSSDSAAQAELKKLIQQIG